MIDGQPKLNISEKLQNHFLCSLLVDHLSFLFFFGTPIFKSTFTSRAFGGLGEEEEEALCAAIHSAGFALSPFTSSGELK